MTSTPASGGAAGEPVGDASGLEVGGFADAQTGADVAALVAAVDRLAAGEVWHCSEADLGRLVQSIAG